MQPAPILVVGDSMLDRYWEGCVERISPEAPVPILRFDREWRRPGGAANVAANLCALGSPTALATLLGEDEAGDHLAQLMADRGVALHTVRSAQIVTTQKIRAVCNRHQLLRIDIERPAPPDTAQALCALVQDLLPRHRWVMLSDYHKGTLCDCESLISSARTRGCRVMIDPKGGCFDQYRGAWLLKPNESEAAAVAGPWTDDQAFSRAMAGLRTHLGLNHLLVTRGERGMSLFSADINPIHIPTVAQEVYDVSGAGDTVLAALAAFLASGETLMDAMHHANRAASIAVGKFGTAIVSRQEVLREAATES